MALRTLVLSALVATAAAFAPVSVVRCSPSMEEGVPFAMKNASEIISRREFSSLIDRPVSQFFPLTCSLFLPHNYSLFSAQMFP